MPKIRLAPEFRFTQRLLSIDTWPDLETLISHHRNLGGGCWCTYHLLPSNQFKAMSAEERKRTHQQMVIQKIATGLILYADEKPVGWCQFGKAEIFEQINRSRAYKAFSSVNTLKPDWRITCILVDKDYRRQGLQKRVLSAALDTIRSFGGGVIEAFPFDIPNNAKPQYNGQVQLYSREGFVEIARFGITVLMRKAMDSDVL